MSEFNYNQKIDYIDATYDQHFNAARRWAAEHNTTFEEHINERATVDGVLHRYFYIGEEVEFNEHEESHEQSHEETVPEKSKEIAEIEKSCIFLNSTDWVVTKLCEYKIYHTEEEYLEELEKYRTIVSEREAARNRINEAEKSLPKE